MPENKNIDVSIIIPNYNTKELLEECLNSIYKEIKTISFEIIVVDNSSIDESKKMLIENFTSLKLIKNSTNLGFAKACNTGVLVSKGRYILLLNTDTLILENAIDKLVCFADENKTVGIIGPRLINLDYTNQSSLARFPRIMVRNKIKIKSHDNVISVDWIKGACLLIRKEVFENGLYLDESFYVFGEDIDFCYRVKKNGWNIVFYPFAKVMHYGRITGKKTFGIACFPKANYEATIKFFKKNKPFYYVFLYRLTRAISCISRSFYFYILFKIKKTEIFKEKFQIYWIGFLICVNKYK